MDIAAKQQVKKVLRDKIRLIRKDFNIADKLHALANESIVANS